MLYCTEKHYSKKYFLESRSWLQKAPATATKEDTLYLWNVSRPLRFKNLKCFKKLEDIIELYPMLKPPYGHKLVKFKFEN